VKRKIRRHVRAETSAKLGAWEGVVAPSMVECRQSLRAEKARRGGLGAPRGAAVSAIVFSSDMEHALQGRVGL